MCLGETHLSCRSSLRPFLLQKTSPTPQDSLRYRPQHPGFPGHHCYHRQRLYNPNMFWMLFEKFYFEKEFCK